MNEKLEIIKLRDDGASFAKIARERNMNESSVRSLYKRREKLRLQASTANPSQQNLILISRTRTFEKMERLLSLWVLDLDHRAIPVGKRQIQNKARSLYMHVYANLEDKSEFEMNQKDFVASNGWFENYKKRHDIKSVKLIGEAKSADQQAAKTYPQELQTIIDEGGYSEDQIFNVDEAGKVFI